jgi:membrane-bound lytic murein transglycosylase D
MEEFTRGREAALSGDFQCAHEAFGRALETVRPVSGPVPTDPEVMAFSSDLYEGILRYEALAAPGETEASEGQGTPDIAFPETPQTTQVALLQARQAVSSDSAEALADIPIVINDAVLRIVAAYQNDYHDIIARGLTRSGRFVPMIQRIFEEEGLPRDLAQVAMVESSFIPHARSPKAACGIWQFMPRTGRQYGLTSNAVVDERSDPEKATRAAARYLRYLHELFHDWYLAMAAYNAGEGRVLRAMERTGLTDFWQLAGSGLLKPQTQNYVPAVIAATLIVKNPSHYGFEVEYEKPLVYETVRLDRPVNLRRLAVTEQVPLEELQRLNPELRSDVTPRQPDGYELKVPLGGRSSVLAAFAAAPTARPPAFRRHLARRGETLASIARRSHVSLASLASVNSLPQRGKLARGKVVLIPEREPLLAVKKGKGKLHSKATQVAQARPQPRSYRVRGGDTLYRIAVRHGLTVARILAVNALPAAGTIKPGDKLRIPAR